MSDTKDETQVVIDPTLQEKLQVLRKLVGIDNLLNNGIYPGAAAQEILEAKTFVQSLHKPLMEEAQAHPDFAKIPSSKGTN